jgi:hypothetical protein
MLENMFHFILLKYFNSFCKKYNYFNNIVTPIVDKPTRNSWH